MRLPRHAEFDAIEVAHHRGPPVLEALAREQRRQMPMQLPGPSLRTSQLRDDRSANDLELEAHAREQPIELVVTEINLSGEETTDARLTHAAGSRQTGLRGARIEHHLAQHVAPTDHTKL